MSTAHRLESFASHACTRCASRKVKCDRRLPSCERCVESRSACIYVAPPPRRRRRKVLATETATAAKLRQYEDLMQAHGISVPHEAAGSSKVSPLLQNNQTAGHATSRSTTQSEPETDGASVNANSHGSTTGNAYEGNELWRGITQLRGPIDARDDGASWPLARDDQPLETDTDPLWGHPAGTGLEDDWPQPEVVMALWHTYLERFHPIYKILHAPSVDILVRNGAATCVGLSAAEKALLCAIFATAVYTVPVEDQCLTRFGGKRSELLRLYRRLARDALSVANYLLTMDLMTIQAFVIFLVRSPWSVVQ